MSQRPLTLSKVTRTADASAEGAEDPTVVVWSTNTNTTAWLMVAETDDAAGTVATAVLFSSVFPAMFGTFVKREYQRTYDAMGFVPSRRTND